MKHFDKINILLVDGLEKVGKSPILNDEFLQVFLKAQEDVQKELKSKQLELDFMKAKYNHDVGELKQDLERTETALESTNYFKPYIDPKEFFECCRNVNRNLLEVKDMDSTGTMFLNCGVGKSDMKLEWAIARIGNKLDNC